jgi:hypothetical protein
MMEMAMAVKWHETRLSLGAGQELGNLYCIFSCCQGLAASGPSKKQAGAVPVSSAWQGFAKSDLLQSN